MNGSTDIPTIQANIEWYLKKHYNGKIDAMNWESAEDGAPRLILFRGGEPALRHRESPDGCELPGR